MASAYKDVDQALASGEPGALRQGLDVIARARLELDDLERRTVDAARRAGLTWSDIAIALRLGSRQAAEQRRLRLGSSGRTRDVSATRQARNNVRADDRRAGPTVSRLRTATLHAADTISLAAPSSHADLAVLAEQTLRAAAEAPPGALIDLAAMAADDLRRIPRAASPALAGALDALDSALLAARTLGNRDDE